MEIVRDLIIKAPYLCGASDPSRFSELGGFVYDDDKHRSDSPFKRNRKDVDEPYNRVKFAFLFTDGDEKKKNYCMKLARIAELTHYKVAHGDNTVRNELDALIIEAADLEIDYPDVAEIMTVDQAASESLAAGGW